MRYPSAPHAPVHAAFTLIEMVVSLSIVSIVFLAMGSVMVLATKAIPSPDAPTKQTLDAADLLEQMASELEIATSVTVATDKGISFTVPDRDNDDHDETIIHIFGGVTGSPLVRKFNEGAVVNVLPSVCEFTLTYDTKPVPQPDSIIESPEIELISYDSSSNLSDAHVKSDQWWGQYFKPSLPADAAAWSVKRVKYMAKQDKVVPMTLKLCIPSADSSKPSGTVVDTTYVDASALTGSYQWVESTFANAGALSPSTGLFLTFSSDLNNPARLRYQDKNVLLPNLGLALGGPVWIWGSANTNQSLLFYVYGTYSTLSPQPPIYLLRSVSITLNIGKAPATRVQTAVNALNQPQMP